MKVKPALISGAPGRKPGSVSRWGQLYGCSAALAITELADLHDGPLLLVVADPRQADQAIDELAFFADGDVDIQLFPDSETLPYDAFSPHPDLVSRRLAVLSRLPAIEKGVVVVALSTLLQRLPPAEWVEGSSLILDVGVTFDAEAFRTKLSAAGYASVPQVSEHGEFATRGSIIDVFPMGADHPYRIDLFDKEIDSIRSFDPVTQRSADKLDSIRLLPAREYPFDSKDRESFRQRFRDRFPQDLSRVLVYRDVSDNIAPGGIEYYLPLFYEKTATLLDYLPGNVLAITFQDALGGAGEVWQSICDRHEQLRHDLDCPRLSPEELFVTPAELSGSLGQYPIIDIQGFKQVKGGHNLGASRLPPMKVTGRRNEPGEKMLSFLNGFDGRVLFTAESAGRREVLAGLLAAQGLRPAVTDGWKAFLGDADQLALAIAPLDDGVVLDKAGIAIIPESAIFGERARPRRRRSRRGRDAETIIRQLSDLTIGAPVVHAEYGIGRYLGLQTLTAGGRTGEFLTLEYAGEDRLYVPVQSLDLISRYAGSSPDHAPLHRLGSDQWLKARRRAARKAHDVAAELLDVHARRAARSGNAHHYDEGEFRAFCEAFPFDETPDQNQAIEDVIGDLRAPKPADRVVCGDVGFGKTEVALRAAFIAAQDGKQVAILVPTTLLAQQHYQTFSDRFADWPVRVEVLSRFRTGKQVDSVATGLTSGDVDIVIGTHRLLQKDISFRNLGLIIIDEEHRFGVRHKESLRKIRANVDVLTLTATPIPRTLNMAMGGLRDLSMIVTAPSERLAVKTFVTEWKDPLIREACLREIRRGGQIYFLHNRVETIDKIARQLAELIPEARLQVAHGKMRERELEQIMLDFYHRRFNLLVCTTIIESGLDVPTANTIIIDRADRLGLAQLHQLRGRVGRSHHRAYAYLLTPHESAMTPDAIKRLEAIESLEELGAGFMLATHDLEIRGAGELLGADQSGQIHEIGFSMYMELLERAVRHLKSGRVADPELPLEHGTEVDVGEVALIPDDYVPDVHMRLVLYKRVASAKNEEALRELQVELIDRFGLLPDPAKMLFLLAAIRLKAVNIRIAKVEAGPTGGHIRFHDDTTVEPTTLIRLIQHQPSVYRLDGQRKLRFNREMPTIERRLDSLHSLLDDLAGTTT
ncbi:MAG: transcription-repair coupling factor [Gammaproteobacteria bacterium]